MRDKTLIVLVAFVALALALSACDATGEAKKSPKPQCSDSIDNDGDGFCDFTARRCRDGTTPGDPDCESAADDNEATEPYCGDGTCGAGEDCTNCVADCGACPPICGDGDCNGAETCETCEQDCGVCPPVCGDGVCEGDETCSSCIPDCGHCDQCFDTDGGWNVDVRGNVSGFKNNIQYSYIDYCLNNNTVKEYYCVGDQAVNADVQCSSGNISEPYSGCASGACY